MLPVCRIFSIFFLLLSVCFGIGATILTHKEIQCLLYARFVGVYLDMFEYVWICWSVLGYGGVWLISWAILSCVKYV